MCLQVLPDGVRLRDRVGHGEVVAGGADDVDSMEAASRLLLDFILLLLRRAGQQPHLSDSPRGKPAGSQALPHVSQEPLSSPSAAFNSPPIDSPKLDEDETEAARIEGAFSSYRSLFHPAVRLAQDIHRSIFGLLELPHCDASRNVTEYTRNLIHCPKAIEGSGRGQDQVNKKVATVESCSCLHNSCVVDAPSLTLGAIARRVAAACVAYHGQTLFRPREEYEYVRLLAHVTAGVEEATLAARETVEAKMREQEARTLRSRQRATLR